MGFVTGDYLDVAIHASQSRNVFAASTAGHFNAHRSIVSTGNTGNRNVQGRAGGGGGRGRSRKRKGREITRES